MQVVWKNKCFTMINEMQSEKTLARHWSHHIMHNVYVRIFCTNKRSKGCFLDQQTTDGDIGPAMSPQFPCFYFHLSWWNTYSSVQPTYIHCPHTIAVIFISWCCCRKGKIGYKMLDLSNLFNGRIVVLSMPKYLVMWKYHKALICNYVL